VEWGTNVTFGEAFGKAVFANPANAKDLYLHTGQTPFTLSPVYRGPAGGLPFSAAFQVHFAPHGSNTTISVIALETEVINRTKFGWGPCGPGEGTYHHRVRPTTIEEYTLLRYLGPHLGVTNMPPVILPKRT